MSNPKTIPSNRFNDWWECACGNTAMRDGFHPADPDTANAVEPTPHGWDGRSVVCLTCRRVMDQATLRPMDPAPADPDALTHLVDVIRGPRTDVDPSADYDPTA